MLLVPSSKSSTSAAVSAVLATSYALSEKGLEQFTISSPSDASSIPVLPAYSPKPISKVSDVSIDQGLLFGSASIARYLIQELSNESISSSLYPIKKSAKTCADIDAWMTIAIKTVGPLASILGDATSKPEIAAASKSDLFNLIAQSIESKLTAETYIIPSSKSVTLADIFLASALEPAFADIATAKPFPHTTRYLLTILNQPALQKVFKKSYSIDDAKAAVASRASSQSASSAPKSSSGEKKKFRHHRNRIEDILQTPDDQLPIKSLKVAGWCRTVRVAKGPVFVELSDGSTIENLQVVLHPSFTDPKSIDVVREQGTIGASFEFVGELIKSPAKGQRVEFQVKTATLLGGVPDPLTYPLAKTKTAHTVEYLREVGHLRPRTNLISAITRVRSICAYAVHQFFNERGFLYIHTPIITASDCEGAGEMFQVTTLLDKEEELFKPKENEKKELVQPTALDYTKDFFAKKSYLTVSGQLNVECFACSMSDVYTFGPTFRAENSNTHRHLAEFWMIEPEIAFATLEDDMNLAEDFLKHCIQTVLDRCNSDLEFFEEKTEPGLRDRLRRVLRDPFIRLPYTKGVEILVEHIEAGKVKFENPVSWGVDLATEHERYLTEVVYEGTPVILTHYPAAIKAFYMRQSREDPRCVEAMDILCPRVGEIIGGSAREEDLDRLDKRIVEMGLKLDDFAWYRDLRRYGSIPHAGFGMGFERLVLFVTGVHNIREVIPFPRYPQHCMF